MVQLVPLCFQVLTEGLLECWSHFGHRPGVAAPQTSTQIWQRKRDKRRQGGRTLIHLPFKHPAFDMEPKTEASDSEHLVPVRAVHGGASPSFQSTSILVTAAEGPHPTQGPYLGASTSSTECCEQEQAAERNETGTPLPSFYTT